MKIGQHRELFAIPDDIAYFNTAYNAPLLRSSHEALLHAASAKLQPWQRKPSDFFADAERLRELCAALFGAAIDDYAIIPAASYGVSTAARIFEPEIGPGNNILLMDQEFPSNVLAWRRVAKERGARILTVGCPHDRDWTTAITSQIDSNVKVVAISACHWTDGAKVDLAKVSDVCRTVDAKLVLDVTQSLGADEVDIARVQPDFLVAAGYKWLLGPYGFGIMYVSPRWHDARPLEEGWLARRNSEDFAKLVEYNDNYRPGARRFDVGETCVTTVLPGAIKALEQLGEWGIATIAAHLREINNHVAEAIESAGFVPVPRKFASPHILGVSLPDSHESLPERFAQQRVFVSRRGAAIRIAPHFHSTQADIDRLIATCRDIHN